MKQQNIANLRGAVFTVMAVFTLAIAAIPASAQNAVPPTARAAAASPAFAPLLNRPATPQAAGKSSASASTRPRPLSPLSSVIYENGPINGNTDAWPVNFPFSVSDSFTVTSAVQVTGITFGAWLFPGDSTPSFSVQIGTSPFGTQEMSLDGLPSLQLGDCATNNFGFDICTLSISWPGRSVGPGTYWITLDNAAVTSGDPVYWDENSGVGCHSPGCPSQAYENTVGTIASEAFDITASSCSYDESNRTQAQPQAPTFKVIYNFTGLQDGGYPNASLAKDAAGNLYGTTVWGGYTGFNCYPYGCGTVFKLSNKGFGWVFTSVYSFEGNDGDSPQSLIIGPRGILYGATQYGGEYRDGTIFNLRPSAVACKTALCAWTETVLYPFNGGGYPQQPTIGVFDQAGNLYGTTGHGGLYGGGTVFELTPSGIGWAETVVHDFSGSDGELPVSGVIFDQAGNLYGTTNLSGLYGYGTVFQLVPSGSGWTASTLYSFQGGSDGGLPISGVIFDPLGNLYGTTAGGGSGCGGGTVFELVPSGGTWTFTSLYGFNGKEGPVGSLVMDADGNLYGTTFQDGAYEKGSVFRMTPGSGGWTYNDLYDFTGGADGGGPNGLTWDANGNLWGTASRGGAYGQGVIFEITP